MTHQPRAAIFELLRGKRAISAAQFRVNSACSISLRAPSRRTAVKRVRNQNPDGIGQLGDGIV